jgi:hypothetical protein
MRARPPHAAHNLIILKHPLNPICLDPIRRNGGINARCFMAATSDAYRKYLPGLVLYSCDYPAHRPMGHAIYVVSA